MATTTTALARFAVASTMCLATIAGCSADGSTSSYGDDASEYQLATLEKGSPATDAEVQPYKLALDAAVPLCDEPRSEIGDIAFVANRELTAQGIKTSVLEMLQAIPAAVPAEMAPTSCAQIVAAIMTLTQ